MKSKKMLWYLGYVVSLILIVVIFLTDFPVKLDIALMILSTIIFSVTHVEVLHRKMLQTDKEYRVSVLDERNISIKEKAGSITNMITMILLGLTTVAFIQLNYIIPAIIVGAIVVIQPIILSISSNFIEKKM